jgi:hypothetical protein
LALTIFLAIHTPLVVASAWLQIGNSVKVKQAVITNFPQFPNLFAFLTSITSSFS